MNNPSHLDHVFIATAMAIEKKMPRRLHALALHTAPVNSMWYVRAPLVISSRTSNGDWRLGTILFSRALGGCFFSELFYEILDLTI